MLVSLVWRKRWVKGGGKIYFVIIVLLVVVGVDVLVGVFDMFFKRGYVRLVFLMFVLEVVSVEGSEDEGGRDGVVGGCVVSLVVCYGCCFVFFDIVILCVF